MFREMTRFKQALSNKECIELLKNEPRGVLSVIGDDGYPYGMPMNHWYCEEDGKIYFHGGKRGHKIEAIKKCDKVSFCVYDKGVRIGDDWPLHIKSVIVFGRISITESYEKTIEISRALSYKFTNDEKYIDSEIEKSGANTLCFALTPEHISGKSVTES